LIANRVANLDIAEEIKTLLIERLATLYMRWAPLPLIPALSCLTLT